jgi:ABC-type transporter Mla subunit MlaD
MGQHYVAVKFGEAGVPIENGTELVTLEQPDLSTLMAKLEGVAEGVENMTSSFSGDTFGDILGPLGDLIQQNKDKLSNMLTNLEKVSGDIANGEGTVGKLISDRELYDSTIATVDKLKKSTDQITETLAAPPVRRPAAAAATFIKPCPASPAFSTAPKITKIETTPTETAVRLPQMPPSAMVMVPRNDRRGMPA